VSSWPISLGREPEKELFERSLMSFSREEKSRRKLLVQKKIKKR